MTFRRFSEIIPPENIFIVTNENYAELTKQQLPAIKDSQLLLEPQRRNTAPCIAWASYHIKSINPNANIVVSPSDHLILNDAGFRNTITKGLDFASKNDVLITLGITPSRPETGYGYIQTTDIEKEGFYKVKTFTEKPDLTLAKIFVESGEFLWNSGIFIWNVNSILNAFKTYLPDMTLRFEAGVGLYNTNGEKEFIKEMFPSCSNLSIDFGIMEKSSDVYVLPADFGWSDLGTWGSLYDSSEKDENNNVALGSNIISYESKNNIVSLPDDHIAVIHGLEDYIIAESDSVLMICKKEEEQKIRQFVTDAKVKFGDKYI